MRRFVPTPQITTGPFFPAQIIRAEDSNLTRGAATGEVIALSGAVRDADGGACVNAILEIWQADAHGRFATPGFHGWGRTWTDEAGQYRFVTVKPGATNARAPFINVMLHASGLMRPLVTQLFFPGEALNDRDPQLALVPGERRPRLIARPWSDPAAPTGAMALRFDVALGGADETPFLED